MMDAAGEDMDEITKIIATYFIILPILLAIYLLWNLKSKHERIEFSLVLIGGGVLSLLLAHLSSHFISDPRPFVVDHFTPLVSHSADNGFPSDHTLLSAFLSFAILGYSTRLGIVALVIAASIGLARVAAGVHHMEDIVGSFVIAGIVTFVAIWCIQHFLPANSQPTRHRASGDSDQ